MPKGAPPQVPVKSYPTPNIHSDVVLTETWNTENAGAEWQPLDPGTPHPNTRDFPGFKLARMDTVPGQDKWQRRVWVTDNVNQDLYNYAVKYVAESNGYPIFIRQYQELRATYAPRAKGTALQTVFKILLTAAGSGYQTPPAVTLSGGGGSGATAEAVLNQDGTLAEVVLLAGGLSYTSAPAVAIAAGSGTGATAAASIQPSGAILVSEEAQNYDPQDPNFNLYVQVMRVYKTLPGPLLTGATQNPNGVAGTIQTQDVAYGTASDSGADVLESTITPVSSVESKRETRTGVLWIKTDGLQLDANRRFNAAFGLEQTLSVGETSSPAITTGIDVVQSTSKPGDNLRYHLETSTAPFSTTTVSLLDYDERGDPVDVSRTWVDPASSLPAQTYLSKVQRSPETKDRAQQDVSNYSSRTTLTTYQNDERAQGAISTTTNAIEAAASGVPPSVSRTFGVLSVKSIARTAEEAEVETTSVSTPFPILTEYELDDFAQEVVKITKQVVQAGTTTGGISAGVLTEVKPIDELYELKIVSQYPSLPSAQPIAVTASVSIPPWFTSGPTLESASSGYTADQGVSYALESEHGEFPAVLHRVFSTGIPSAPSGTILNFTPVESHTDTPYSNTGTEPYCKILHYDLPNHIAARPSGDYILSIQAQPHRMLWVQEYIVVTLP
jgi:hypothetical protein